jgi:DNA-binding response OmpR family regulator
MSTDHRGARTVSTTTVMVVEDDAAFRARFCRIVAQSEELSLLAAVGDLAAARATLERQVPDVLLIDLGLPDGSGMTSSARPRRSTPPPTSWWSPCSATSST